MQIARSSSCTHSTRSVTHQSTRDTERFGPDLLVNQSSHAHGVQAKCSRCFTRGVHRRLRYRGAATGKQWGPSGVNFPFYRRSRQSLAQSSTAAALTATPATAASAAAVHL